MKYFTLDWWNGIQNGEPEKDPFKEYENYFKSIKEKLPKAFLQMREEVHFHDSKLQAIYLDAERKTLQLNVFTYNHNESLETVSLVYSDVTKFASSSTPEKGLPGPLGYGDWGYDEVEIISGKLEHRILFSGGIEFVIQFENVELIS